MKHIITYACLSNDQHFQFLNSEHNLLLSITTNTVSKLVPEKLNFFFQNPENLTLFYSNNNQSKPYYISKDFCFFSIEKTVFPPGKIIYFSGITNSKINKPWKNKIKLK